jgi:hypothetical protein
MEELLEKAKTNHKLLRKLKLIAVNQQMYEFACKLREMEKSIFPEQTEESKKAEKEGDELNLLFRMVDMNIQEKTCWLINETLKVHRKKKGKFDIADAVKIKHKCNELFD